MTTTDQAQPIASELHRHPQFPGHRLPNAAKGDYYDDTVHGPHQIYKLGDFELDSGQTLSDAGLTFKTHGKLSAAKDNAILFPHMYSGTPKAMEAFIGPGRPLDPSKYFIILPGQFGNGFSSSPTNQPAPQDARAFPAISIGDDVRAQHQLVTKGLGIKRLQLVLGWSMGAQQTYEWAVRYPDSVLRAMPIGGTAKTTPHSYLTVQMLEGSIMSDPDWANGDYGSATDVAEGIRLHASNFSVLGVSPEFYQDEVWRDLGFASLDMFYEGFWQGWFGPMDPNNLLCMSHKWRTWDVGAATGSDLETALQSIKARTVVVGFRDDQLAPPEAMQREAEMLPPHTNPTFRLVDTQWSHFAMMCFADSDRAAIDKLIGELLAAPA